MKNKNLGIILLLLFLISVSGAACSSAEPFVEDALPLEAGQTSTGTSLIAEGNLLPADFAYLTFQLNGTIAEILVEEGSQVSGGQILARLGEGESYQAALSAAAFELESARQALDDLKERAGISSSQAKLALSETWEAQIAAEKVWQEFEDGDFQDRLDDAEIKLTEALQGLEDAQDDFDSYEDLDVDNPTRKRYKDLLDDAQQTYDDAVWDRDLLLVERARQEAELASVQADYDLAETNYNDLKNGPDPDALSLAEARLLNAENQQKAAEAALELLEIRAPFSGKIVEVNVVKNEQIQAYQSVFLLADFSEWVVETTDLTELEVTGIFPGQQVNIVPDALPEVKLSGKVERISEVYEKYMGDIVYTVRILVDEPIEPQLRWGMTVELTFEEE